MNTKTITKRLITGSTLRVLFLGSNIIVAFIMMPFVIHSLGGRLYGFWIFIGTFMGYYGFLDFGLSSAVSRYMSRAYGQKDYNEMNIVINTSLLLFSIVGLFTMVVTVLVVLLCPYFIHDAKELSLFQIVILILGVDISISFPMRAFGGVLISKLRYDLTTFIQFAALAIRTFLIYYFIKSGHGLVALAIITFCVNLISHYAKFVFVKREFPDLRFGFSYILRERIKLLFAYSKYTFFYSAC